MNLTVVSAIRRPDDLVEVIYGRGRAEVASEGTKVFHLTVLVEEGMVLRLTVTPLVTRHPDYVAKTVYVTGRAEAVTCPRCPRKCTEVLYLIVVRGSLRLGCP